MITQLRFSGRGLRGASKAPREVPARHLLPTLCPRGAAGLVLAAHCVPVLLLQPGLVRAKRAGAWLLLDWGSSCTVPGSQPAPLWLGPFAAPCEPHEGTAGTVAETGSTLRHKAWEGLGALPACPAGGGLELAGAPQGGPTLLGAAAGAIWAREQLQLMAVGSGVKGLLLSLEQPLVALLLSCRTRWLSGGFVVGLQWKDIGFSPRQAPRVGQVGVIAGCVSLLSHP